MSDSQILITAARFAVAQLTDQQLAVFGMILLGNFGDPKDRPGFEHIELLYKNQRPLLEYVLQQAIEKRLV